MNKDENEYVDGFNSGYAYWEISQWGNEQMSGFSTPKSWSDIRSIGFWDGVVKYCLDSSK